MNDYENMKVVRCSRCGAEDVMKVYPGESEKKSRSRAKKHLCFECYKKMSSSADAEYNRRRGYSKLRGSPKQIDYAEQLRKKHIFRVVNHLEVIGQNAFAKRAEKYLGSKSRAKWWVENSEYSKIEKHIEEQISRATNKAC